MRTGDKAAGSSGESAPRPALARNGDDASALVRDMFALATLPAMWMGAAPHRIGESLLAALDATLRPELGFFRFVLDAASPDRETIELAHLSQKPLPAVVAREVGRRILDWATRHDPEELLLLTDVGLGAPVRVWVHPLQQDARNGVLAVGFAGAHRPSESERLLLNMAATQANVACRNAELKRRADAELRQREHVEAALRESEASLRSDMAERERAEQALRDSEERYRRLARLLPVAVYTVEAPLGTITYFNEHAAEAWGRTPQLGERYCGSLRLYLDDDTPVPHEECAMAIALREGRPFRNQEVVIERPDGSRITALVNIDPIHDASGAVTGAINVFHDVTAHKRSELELREQKENLETLLETLPVAVFFAGDAAASHILGNRTASELLRMPHGANLSMSATPPERPKHVRVTQGGREVAPDALPVQRAARGEVVHGDELAIEFDDGVVVQTLCSARPLFDPEGRPRGAVASILDITGMKEAERALREAARRKDEFLATLAHELRNPLAPIRSSLELAKQSEDDPRVMRLARDTIERQVDHLVRLVDDLLDVSRITRDRLDLRKTDTELASIIQQAVETCRPLAAAEAQTIRVTLPPGSLPVHADPVRLTQVFSNLLNNACKYTPAGGTIALSVIREGTSAIVTVEDDGIGIPPESLGSVFDMFSQVDGAVERSRGGLGIGLTLVKRLVELHGGSIAARSDGIGKGSTFEVRLPALAVASARGDRTLPEPTAMQPAVARRVLVVDDNEDAAQMLALLLRRSGHETRLAFDGEEAVALAEEFRPEVILLDIGLPKLDGREACRRIRGAPWSDGIVVVALSGWGQEEDRCKTREAGFDDHFVKPVSHDAIAQLLASLPDPQRATGAET
jgi:PAS domain S-box-containing protein